jgi:hypothetical protein
MRPDFTNRKAHFRHSVKKWLPGGIDLFDHRVLNERFVLPSFDRETRFSEKGLSI